MKNFLNQHFGSAWTAKKLVGDSGERQYHRIAAKDRTFILVSYPSDMQKSLKSFLHVQGVFQQHKFAAPKILAQDLAEGFVLLEDLGSFSLEKHYLENQKLDFHKTALDFLQRLQTELGAEDLKTVFSVSQGLREMIFAYQQLDYSLLEDDKKQLFEEFRKINEKLVQPSLVCSHRDFHSRNLFIHKNLLYVIDFQDAGFYPLYYDIVSLIEDPYAALSDQQKQQLMNYYEKKWGKSIEGQSFQLTAAQRLFKAVGSFMSFFHLRGQKHHLKYVIPSLKRVEFLLSQKNEYPCFLKYVQQILSHL